MTRPATPPLLGQIRSPSSPASQVDALKALKNDIIGHEQKKEMWIGFGVLAPLVRTLSTSRSEGKRPTRDLNGNSGNIWEPASLTDEEQARLQATIIIGSLAHGSSAFATSLLRASAISFMLSALSTAQSPPQLVLATLQTFNTLADALSLMQSSPGMSDSTLSSLLFSNDNVENLVQILSQSSASSVVQQQVALAASLIAKTCHEDRHQAVLANSGVLDALATRLASFVVSMGFVLPGADQIAQNEGRSGNFPNPAPGAAVLHPLLEAISVIIQDSRFRATKLLYSPAIFAVFPSLPPDMVPDWLKNPPGKSHPPFSRTSEQGHLNPIDYLLPPVPTNHRASSAASTAFPPLGSTGSISTLNTNLKVSSRSSWPSDQSRDSNSASRIAAAESAGEDESPLIAWLFYITRGEDGLTRLMAALLLTVLYKTGLTHKRRESSLALLVVPLLVRMFDSDSTTLDPISRHPSLNAKSYARMAKERAPSILAMLVTDSMELQKAAVDAHAIKKLSQMLKVAFDPPSEATQGSTWSPYAQGSTRKPESGVFGPASTSRGADVCSSSSAMHRLKVRESTLKALAALAPFKDEYRKMIIDNGVTPFIVDSLEPSDTTNRTSSGQNTSTGDNRADSTLDGNPAPVLIAACGAVRALSRSVSILRTSLIDAGVAMPLFELLKHPEIEVQIAATAAVCNLVLEFSPMREAIMRAGVLRVLCEHAHSTNPRLRLNAVWALKHLVFSAENDVKVSCLEELGQGWLVQLICDDTENKALASCIMRDNGEMVAELPAGGSIHSQEGDGPEDLTGLRVERSGEDTRMSGSVGSFGRSQGDFDLQQGNLESLRPSSQRSKESTQSSERLSALREAETNLAIKARRDDAAVQEQGLDFIRNLICGPGSVSMIDFLFGNLGQDRVFEILSLKLRHKAITAQTRERRYSLQGYDTRLIQPQSEIIIAVCFILVHIAAGHPRHRQILVSQTELLKLLLPLFGHANKQVRVALAWMIINLTWVDDQADQIACKGRASELKKLGFQSKLEALESDPELDVRERTKTALFQLRQNTM
ncbi:MAG: hypothetical protein M1837_007432 [Sclerophora amabilis]|nr:MAG: hypothetical protein M1837_007432 [Sclerophora amabilis]